MNRPKYGARPGHLVLVVSRALSDRVLGDIIGPADEQGDRSGKNGEYRLYEEDGVGEGVGTPRRGLSVIAVADRESDMLALVPFEKVQVDTEGVEKESRE